MAGIFDWVKMRVDLERDPKVSQIACDLLLGKDQSWLAQGVSRECHVDVTLRSVTLVTLGALYVIWATARRHGRPIEGSTDCLLKGVDTSYIEMVTGVIGLDEAMERAGWLAHHDDGIVLKNFFEHNELAKAKSPSERKAAQRQREREAKAQLDARVSRKSRDICVTQNVTCHTEEEEEEEEEEKEEEEKKDGSSLNGNSNVATEASPSAADRAFDEFWKLYPRKAGKQKAKSAFQRAVKRKPAAEVIAAAALFASSPKGRGEFCPYPATWLNEGRWDDDPAEWSGANGHALREDEPEVYQATADEWRALQMRGRLNGRV